MTIRHNGFVRRLIEIQKAHGWKDGEMARRLSVSRPFWVRIKNGERIPGRKFLSGALSAFPELADEAIEFLVGGER
jgi:transcriptional regulator with XRE-family HTH domain